MVSRRVCTVCTFGNLRLPNSEIFLRQHQLVMFGRIGGQALRCAARRPVARGKLSGRRFSGQTATNAAPTSSPSPLGGITVELDRIAPRFEVPASQITILDSPASFYSTLKVR